jgi:hypothetical protein
VHLSSLAQSNDSTEGKLVTQKIMQILSEDNLKTNERLIIEGLIQTAGKAYSGFGFCLSREGDLLSQWRGYADDGQGVSIGFSKHHLNLLVESIQSDHKVSAGLAEVLYDKDEQNKIIKKIYNEIKKFVTEVTSKNRGQQIGYTEFIDELRANGSTLALYDKISRLYGEAFKFKKEAFKEESESRLLLLSHTDLSQIKFGYRASGNKIIPYLPIKFPQNLVTEIILGPKNKTPRNVVRDFLNSMDFNNVRIVKSDATYQ